MFLNNERLVMGMLQRQSKNELFYQLYLPYQHWY